jgi:hypothetical protein
MLAAALGLALGLFLSCELGDEADLDALINAAVAAATAPRLNVSMVMDDTRAGRTDPSLPFVARQGLAFSVLFTPDPGYAFAGWEVRADGALLSSGNGVLFRNNDPAQASTEITLQVARGNITVSPRTVVRPAVRTRRPENTTNAVFVNYPVQVWFTQPVDPASFEFSPGVKQRNGAFKNITITGKTQNGLDPDAGFEKYFYDPELDETGTILTLRVRMRDSGNNPLPGVPANSHVSVTLTGGAGGIRNRDGITMDGNADWTYATSIFTDNVAPSVSPIQCLAEPAGNQQGRLFDAACTVDRRFGGVGDKLRRTVYLLFYASDEVSDLDSVRITENRVFDSEGGVVSDTSGEGELFYFGAVPEGEKATNVIYQERRDSAVPWVKEFFAIPSNQNYPFVYVIEYHLKIRTPEQAGIIELALQPRDEWDNELSGSAVPTLRIAYDMKAPIAQPGILNGVTITNQSGGGGGTTFSLANPRLYFNPLVITPPGGIHDRDYEAGSAAATAQSPQPSLAGKTPTLFDWQFYVTNNDDRRTGGWTPLGLFPDFIDLTSFEPGDYPLMVLLRDELGNETEEDQGYATGVTVHVE